MRRLFLAALAAVQLGAQPAVEPRLASETLPAGGTIQIKAEMTSPTPIVVGHFEMDWSSFDAFDGVAAFSPAGDSFGVAYRQGARFAANLVSPQGALGTQLDYPFFVVAANIRSGLASGTKIPLNFGAGLSLTAPNGTPYSIPAPKSGTLTIGGTVSVGNIIPGGGSLPAGYEVRVTGTGFNADTRVDVNEVVITNLRAINSSELRFNLVQGADLTGKRFRVRNRDGSEAVYYSYLRSIPAGGSNRGLLAGAHPIFARAGYTNTSVDAGRQPANGFLAVALENEALTPANVTLQLTNGAGAAVRSATVSLPGGSRWSRTLEEIFNNSGGQGFSVRITSTAPVHVLGLRGDEAAGSLTAFAPGATPPPPPTPELSVSPAAVSFSHQPGDPLPAPASVQVSSSVPLNATVSASAGWITVSPASGATPFSLSIGVNPAGLSPGLNTGTVNVSAPGAAAVAVAVRLTVTGPPDRPRIQVSPASLQFTAEAGGAAPAPRNVQVTSPGGGLNIAAVPSAAWITVSPASGPTPLAVSIGVNPAGLTAGSYSGSVTVSSAGVQPVAIPVGLTVGAAAVPVWSAVPANLRFQYRAGGPAPAAQTLSVRSSVAGTAFSVSSDSWIGATPSSGVAPADLAVTVNPSGLPPGEQTGFLAIQPVSGAPVRIPVSLVVTGPPAPVLNLSRESVSLSYSVGGSLPDAPAIQVTSSGGPMPFRVVNSAAWLEAVADKAETPATLRLRVAVAGLSPGSHTGTVSVIPASGEPRVLTVSLQVVSADPQPQAPEVSSIVNSADQSPGAGVAPGAIVTVYGTGLGPSTPAGGRISSGLFDTEAGGTRVWFGSVPAPVLFTSLNQVNVQVPFEIAGAVETPVFVEYRGVRSRSRTVRVVSAAPAVFTFGSGGQGPGAVLNEDFQVNSSSRPARRGSAVMIFANGGGVTEPGSATGVLADGVLRRLRAETFVWIGGRRVPALYAGSSPGSVTGVIQINAVVPEVVSAGLVPLQIEVGGVMSQSGVTLAVE